MINWLQPANRVWCSLWWLIAATRFNHHILEELASIPEIINWRDKIGLGVEVKRLMALAIGEQSFEDILDSVLLTGELTSKTMTMLSKQDLQQSALNIQEIKMGVLGALLLKFREMSPNENVAEQECLLNAGPGEAAMDFQKVALSALEEGVSEQLKHFEKTVNLGKKIQKDFSRR